MEKKMKKIAFALGIIMCLVVVSVMAAVPATARYPLFYDTPCGWLKEEGDPINLTIDPTMVNFSRAVIGVGHESRFTTISTRRSYADGINARLTAGGSGELVEREKIFIDTFMSDPELEIDSMVYKAYKNITFDDGLVKPKDETLSGMICTRNREVGAAVSVRYSETYEREGSLTHTGDGTVSSTLIDDMYNYGTTRLSVTVKDPVNRTHTILWSREERTGEFTEDYNITVRRYFP